MSVEQAARLLQPEIVPIGAINAELESLAASLGAQIKGQFADSFFGTTPTIDAHYQGFPVRVFGMNHGMGGRNSVSISLIILLPQMTPYKLKMQNVVSMRYNAFVDLAQTNMSPVHNMSTELLAEFLPLTVQQDLQNTNMNFVLTLEQDRLVLTVYGAYQHQLYLNILGLLVSMADVLVTATE